MSHEGPLPKDVWGSLPHLILTLKPCPHLAPLMGCWPAQGTCILPLGRVFLQGCPYSRILKSKSLLPLSPDSDSPHLTFSTFAWYLSALYDFVLIYLVLALLVGLVTYRPKESLTSPSASWNTVIELVCPAKHPRQHLLLTMSSRLDSNLRRAI